MTLVLGFVALAALGTVARWWLSSLNRIGRPVGTLGVNVAAAFALGLLVGASHGASVVVGVGGLGSLSTFSTVVKEVEGEIVAGRRREAIAYTAVTLIAGIAAAWAGLALA